MWTQEETAVLTGVEGTQGSSERAGAEEVTEDLPSLPCPPQNPGSSGYLVLCHTRPRALTDLNFSEGTPPLALHLIP